MIPYSSELFASRGFNSQQMTQKRKTPALLPSRELGSFGRKRNLCSTAAFGRLLPPAKAIFIDSRMVGAVELADGWAVFTEGTWSV